MMERPTIGFKEAINAITKKVEDLSATLEMEEVTKIVIVMPFIM